MRVLLIHNPEAGREEHEAKELLRALKKAGHRVRYRSSKKKGLSRALKKKCDLVLVAGGDGTVGKVAQRMLKTHSKIPLSVLSLGTANNLARTLGFDASAKAAIDELENGCLSEFDVGLARGPWGKRYFFEGAGAGLFADYLRAPMKGGQNKKSKAEELRRHVQALRRRLRNYPAQKWELKLDGKDYSGRYLLWQAMNICSVGPVLTLAAGAKTNDGAFDFVGAREEDRATLMKFLDARLAGKQPKLPLSVHRFRRMCLRWKKSPLHFDDEVWPEKRKKKSGPRKIEVVVKKSALRIWKTEAKK